MQKLPAAEMHPPISPAKGISPCLSECYCTDLLLHFTLLLSCVRKRDVAVSNLMYQHTPSSRSSWVV